MIYLIRSPKPTDVSFGPVDMSQQGTELTDADMALCSEPWDLSSTVTGAFARFASVLFASVHVIMKHTERGTFLALLSYWYMPESSLAT